MKKKETIIKTKKKETFKDIFDEGDVYLVPLTVGEIGSFTDDIAIWDVGIKGVGGVSFVDEEHAHIYFKLLEIEKQLKEHKE